MLVYYGFVFLPNNFYKGIFLFACAGVVLLICFVYLLNGFVFYFACCSWFVFV
jgi:hypothetical protein